MRPWLDFAVDRRAFFRRACKLIQNSGLGWTRKTVEPDSPGLDPATHYEAHDPAGGALRR
jgi:hypothetical protein